MITLRAYQDSLYQDIRNLMKKGHKHILCYMAMRGGKTVVFSKMCQDMAKKNKRCLVVTDRKKLLTQTGSEFNNFDIYPFYITANTKSILDANVYVAMTESLRRRVTPEFLNTIDAVIIDEAHRTMADWLIEMLPKKTFVFGFTGSPKRSGKQTQLGDLYSSMAMGPTTIELEDLGFCVPLTIFKVPSDVMKGVGANNTAAGYEYKNSEMFNAFDKPTLYAGVVDNWKKYTPNTLTMVYCCNIVHAIKTCIAFNEAGIKAKFVTSQIGKPKEPDHEDKSQVARYKEKLSNFNFYTENYNLYSGPDDDILQAWERKEFLVLCNVDKYTFGFNSKPLQTVVINRGTLSTPLWVQMANRSCTPMEGKDHAYLLDMAGNVDRLKEPNYPHTWSLFHETKKGGGVAAVKFCPKCDAMLLASCMICTNPKCGFVFPKSKREQEIELIQHTYANKNPRDIDFTNWSFEDLEDYRILKGYKKTWLFRTLYFIDRLDDYAKATNKNPKWVHVQRQMFAKV